MLEFTRLIVSNFGPYRDEEVLDFPVGGVTLVYGENMRGKTTLLNAFKFALFGKVVTRGGRPVSLLDLINKEGAQQDKYTAKVTLEFSYAGSRYELGRVLRARKTPPTVDSDFVRDTYLSRDGAYLPPAELESELGRIMPEEISRFFLFDGELLSEYEELVRQDGPAKSTISDAIEKILGVPVLKTASLTLLGIAADADREHSAAARANGKTISYGKDLEDYTTKRSAIQANIKRYVGEHAACLQRQKEAEDVLKQNQQAAALLAERDRLIKDLKLLSDRLAVQETEVRKMVGESWRWIVRERLVAAVKGIKQRLNVAKEAQLNAVITTRLLAQIQESIAFQSCRTCEQPLSSVSINVLKDKIATLRASSDSGEVASEIHLLQVLLDKVSPFLEVDQRPVVLSLSHAMDDLRMDETVMKDRIKEIQSEDLAQIAEESIRTAQRVYEASTKELGVLEEQLKQLRNEEAKVESEIQRVKVALANVQGDGRLAAAQAKVRLIESLQKLFRDGIGEYRQRLRDRVEDDASQLFLAMTSEAEYQGLQINQNYGLTILHKDGEPVTVRSAGAEHVVALSLMGALQKNAPMRGPVVMDSPFGRLDETHKRNIVKALPVLADQVMLLVFGEELDSDMARRQLQGKLKAQYRLDRVSARHTKLTSI